MEYLYLKKNCHIAGLKKEWNADTILKNVLMLKMFMPLFFSTAHMYSKYFQYIPSNIPM